MAAVGHPGKVEQAIFWLAFLGPSSTGCEQCGFKKGCSVTLVVAEDGCCSISITQRPSAQGAYVQSMN